MNKKGIYLIDDDELINISTQIQISEYFDVNEFYIETFTDPIDAIEEIKFNFSQNIEPTICIIDFQMPKMNGDKVVRIIKEFHPETKCIMLSGNSSASIVADLVDENLLDFYISKPWEKKELLDKLNQCLPIINKISFE